MAVVGGAAAQWEQMGESESSALLETSTLPQAIMMTAKIESRGSFAVFTYRCFTYLARGVIIFTFWPKTPNVVVSRPPGGRLELESNSTTVPSSRPALHPLNLDRPQSPFMNPASMRAASSGRRIGRRHCRARPASQLRLISGSPGASGPPPAAEDRRRHAPRPKRSESVGLPDWIEHWSRDNFKRFGYALGAAPVALAGLEAYPASALAAVVAAGYWKVGLADIGQKGQTIRRNFPVLGNMRYLLEMIRPEIRQYFVEGDNESVPFSRAQVDERSDSHLFFRSGLTLLIVAPLSHRHGMNRPSTAVLDPFAS